MSKSKSKSKMKMSVKKNEVPATENAPVTETAKTEQVEETKKVEAITVTLAEVAQAIVSKVEGFGVKETEADSYKIIVAGPDIKENFKKGVFFQLLRNSKGFLIEAQLYSVKKGAHLAEFKDEFKALDGTEVEGIKMKYGPKALAGKIAYKVEGNDLENISSKMAAFIQKVEPTCAAIREKVVLEQKPKKVSKKDTKVEKTEEAPPENPETPEAPAEQPQA